MNQLIVPQNLETIEVDVSKKIFKINGNDFGDGCTGFRIACTVEGFDISIELDTKVRYVGYARNGEKNFDQTRERNGQKNLVKIN